MIDISKLLIEFVNSYYSPQWDEEFVEDVGKILQKYKVYSPDDIPVMRSVIACENCKYYDEIEDADMPGYRECHYFSSWTTAHYMLPDDGCTCGKRKESEE